MAVTDSVPGFDDTFFGPKDKAYMDRLARNHVKIRGRNILYYKKLDSPSRTDGDRPLSDKPGLSPLDRRGRKGNAFLYGDPIFIGKRIDTVTREATPAWDYGNSVEMRGVAFRPEQSDTADERGHISTFKLTLQLARGMCEEVDLVPEIGDVVLMPPLLDTYYDVALIRRDNNRFGGTGFFTAYELDLVRSSKFYPERKNISSVPN